MTKSTSHIKKSFVQNISLLVIANLLIKPLWIFGIDLSVQNTLPTEEYGLYFSVFNFSFLFHILLDAGINHFSSRNVAQNNVKLASMYSHLLQLKILFAGIYTLTTFFMAYAVGFNERQWHLLLFLVVNQILLAIVLFNRSNLAARERYRWDAFFSIFDRSLSIVLVGTLLFFQSFFDAFRIEYFIYCQTFSLALSMLFSSILIMLKERVVWSTFSFKTTARLIRQSFPYALLIFFMTIYTRIDAVMLERMLPQSGNIQAGIYAAGYRIFDALNMIPFLAATYLLPIFSKKLKAQSDWSQELSVAIKFLLSVSIGLSVWVISYPNEIIQCLYTQSDETWVDSFLMLVLSFNFICIMYVLGSLITASGKLTSLIVCSACAIIINIGLNYLWIPFHGASGAARATFATQGFIAVAHLFIVKKRWKLSVQWNIWLKMIAYMFILFVISYILHLLHITFIPGSLVLILSSGGLALIFRFIDVKQPLKSMIQPNKK